jgi:hypothetical protein
MIQVLANDSDPDGDVLTLTSTSTPAQGAVAIVGNALRYTPAPGFSGTDSFTYTVSDGRGGTASATVTISVTTTEPESSLLLLPLLRGAAVCNELLAKEMIWQGSLTASCDESVRLHTLPSLRMHAPEPSIVELYSPLVAVQPNSLYRVSYSVKTALQLQGADLYGRVIVAQYNSQAREDDAINHQSRLDPGFDLGESVGGERDWLAQSYTFRTGSDTAFVRLRAVLGGPTGTASGTMWLSDIQFLPE